MVACVCVAQLNSRIKGHHVYAYNYIVKKDLTEPNRHAP